MIIYKTTNLLDFKFYIGKDEKNNQNYYGSGKYFKRALNKYGKENFRKDILEYCFTREELCNREKFWIKLTRSQEFGYNITDGGIGGDTGCTDELKRKRSMNQIGKKNSFYGKHHTEETKIKIRKSSRNRIHTEKTKRKLSENMTGRSNPMFGKNHSEETKQKMRKPKSEEHKIKLSIAAKNRKPISKESKLKISLANKGKKHSEESKLKMRNTALGRKHSEETKRKMSELKSKPIRLDNINYSSIIEACKKLNITRYELRKRML